MKIDVSHFGKNIFVAEIEDFNILEGTPIVIGRDEKCHIHLEDQTLSRKHAHIIYENGKLFVESLSDYKKVELNGNEVSKAELSLQDKVSISDYVLKLTEWGYQTNRRVDAEEADDDATELIGDKTEMLIDEATEILSEEEIPTNEEVQEVQDALEESTEDSEDENEHGLSFDSTDSFTTPDEEEKDESIEDLSEDEEDPFSSDGFEDDGFGDDSFGSDDGFEDSGDSTKVFQNFADYTLILSGSLAPFDKYKIEDNETFIGRNTDKCQIVLNDPEVSGIHAIIKKTLISLTIEDKDSSNGTLVNGERVNKHELQKGDVISIGSTTLKVEVRSELIESEQDILMPVEDNQEVEVEEIVEEEVDFGEDGGFGEPAPQEKGLKAIWKDPARRKKMIYILVGFMVLWIMLDDGESPESGSTNDKPKQEVAKKGTENKNQEKVPLSKKHSPETLERLEENYALALAKYEAGEYYEAKEYLDIVYNIDSEYKDVKTLLELVKQAYEELLRLKAAEEAEKERKKRQLQVKKLMVKTVKAVKDRNIKVAESLFSQVLEIDPENIDIPQLKIEIEAYKEEQERKRIEKERAEAKRKSMVDALAPGKNLYLKQKWYLAIGKLENFNKKKGMDEDLIEEATRMLKDSKIKLDAIVSPLISKARSFKEGQDYKRAYETYGEVLKVNPASEEALNERDAILDRLNNNSKKIYREALISESLSLFSEAKEKFQQVQQISPINSEYYIKATDKLKKYLD